VLGGPGISALATASGLEVHVGGFADHDFEQAEIRAYVDRVEVDRPLHVIANRNTGTFEEAWTDCTGMYLPAAFFTESTAPKADIAKVFQFAYEYGQWSVRGQGGYDATTPYLQGASYAPPLFGGSGNPLGLGDAALPQGGRFYFDVLCHELGHNWSFVNPAFSAIGIPGAFYQETTAEWSVQFYLNRILQEQSGQLSAATTQVLDAVRSDNRTYHDYEYDKYIAGGKQFNYDDISASHVLVKKIYDYCDVAGWNSIRSFYRLFSCPFVPRYSQVLAQHGGLTTENRVTIMIAALSVTFARDVRDEFADLNFPLNQDLYTALDGVLANSPPSAPGVDVAPADPKTDTDLQAVISTPSTDPEQDEIAYEYQWAKSTDNGETWTEWGHDGGTLTADLTAKGEQWKARARATDGHDPGPWAESASVTILNTPPTTPLVDATPDNARTSDDLSCTLTQESTDADDDTLTYQYRWYKDDAQQADYDGQTAVPATATSRGEVWKCMVTPNDGADDGPTAEDQVTVDGALAEWVGSGGWEADGVDPDTGDPSSTTFTFKVKYTDPAGGEPRRARCLIQRRDCGDQWRACRSIALTKESGDIATGAIYSATTTLANLVYKYRFLFKDSAGAEAVGDPTAFQQGPLMVGRPWVCWPGGAGFEADGLDPESGPLGTNFKFQVQYCDAAGDAPLTYKLILRRNGRIFRQKTLAAASSGDLRLGRRYRTSVTLTMPGTYEYRFSLADASGNTLGPPNNWTSGPTITGSASAMVTSLAAAPSRAGAQVTFSLSSAASVSATVVNIAGRPIKTVVADKPLEAGLQTLLWDRRAEMGLPVPAGLYLIRVTARDEDGGQSTALATVALR
jgi:hypothetical protein